MSETETQNAYQPQKKPLVRPCMYGLLTRMPSYHKAGHEDKYLCLRPGNAETIISCPFAVDENGPPEDCPQNTS